MIFNLFKTKCPHCEENIYPEYFRDSQSKICEKCESEIIINLKATYFARMFFFACLFLLLPFLAYIFGREAWIILLAIIVGLIGYAKLTTYSKDAKFTDL